MNEYITGSVRKIIFKGENGYTVGVFKVKDSTDSFEYLNTKITIQEMKDNRILRVKVKIYPEEEGDDE